MTNPHDEALEAATNVYWHELDDTARADDGLRLAIAAYLSALRDAGMVVVPGVPTGAMIRDGSAARHSVSSEVNTVATWRAMVAAAVAGGTEDAG